jgi:hypothetical protein
MEDQIATAQPVPVLIRSSRLALAKSGLWLAVGFVGANGVVAGLIELVSGGAKPLLAVGLLLGGGLLAAGAWWRAQAVIAVADRTPAAGVGASVHVRAGVAART